MLTDLFKLQLDFVGAQAELAASSLYSAMWSSRAPVAARKSPVLALPGFMGSDASMSRLTRYLQKQGFEALTWGLGRNRGLHDKEWNENLDSLEKKLADKIKALADETSEPVSLVGHSLGGVYARELAARMDKEIDRIITMGAPTFHPYKVDRHNRAMTSIGNWLNRQSTSEFGGREGLVHWDPGRPALPCVVIHSPIDAFVDEHACQIPAYVVAQASKKSPRENIRVMSSHVGMMVNFFVFMAVADRLAADRENWQPFDPAPYFPKHLRHAVGLVYPKPKKLSEDPIEARIAEITP